MQKRADILMVEKGLVESRAKAQAMIEGDQVSIDGTRDLTRLLSNYLAFSLLP